MLKEVYACKYNRISNTPHPQVKQMSKSLKRIIY